MTANAISIIRKAYAQLHESLKSAAEQLESEFKAIDDGAIAKSKKATVFILTWMREYYVFQKQFDTLFNRSVMQPAADQFTAVVALTLHRYLASRGADHVVKSEVNLEHRRGTLRPDISVWRHGTELAATIECKTNLGYNRDGWSKQYYERTKRIEMMSKGCLSFLCVLTKENWEKSWPEFSKSNLAGNRWFCLSDVWPSELSGDLTTHIIHPIEPMLVGIRKHLEVPA